MFSSLRLKLLASFFLVIAIGVGTIAYISSNSAISQFDRYVSQDQAERYQRLALTFSNYYRSMGNWDEVADLASKVSEMYNERIVLTDPSGVVIADTAENLTGEKIESDWSSKSVTINRGDFAIGKIYIRTQEQSPLQKTFINSVNKSVLTGGIIAGIVGIVLALLFSRNILKPIRELKAATEKMQEGELDQRVDTTSSGEIGELGESFNELARRLKEQKALREEMVGDVAHELRNPLSNIQGYLEGLKEGMIDPTEEVFETLHQQSLVLNKLVNDLRDVNRAKAGKLNLDKKMVVLEDIVSREIKALEPKAEEDEVKISQDLNGPNTLKGDPARISQVVRNLLDNAITHTPEGGKIRIKTRTSSSEVVAMVSDDGAGIPEKDLPYIFDRFYRVDKSRSRGTGGTGLGLTIAKEIIESHGGRITAKSSEGNGSTFKFTLPLPD